MPAASGSETPDSRTLVEVSDRDWTSIRTRRYREINKGETIKYDGGNILKVRNAKKQ
jgi:hypothetical protein